MRGGKERRCESTDMRWAVSTLARGATARQLLCSAVARRGLPRKAAALRACALRRHLCSSEAGSTGTKQDAKGGKTGEAEKETREDGLVGSVVFLYSLVLFIFVELNGLRRDVLSCRARR